MHTWYRNSLKWEYGKLYGYFFVCEWVGLIYTITKTLLYFYVHQHTYTSFTEKERCRNIFFWEIKTWFKVVFFINKYKTQNAPQSNPLFKSHSVQNITTHKLLFSPSSISLHFLVTLCYGNFVAFYNEYIVLEMSYSALIHHSTPCNTFHPKIISYLFLTQPPFFAHSSCENFMAAFCDEDSVLKLCCSTIVHHDCCPTVFKDQHILLTLSYYGLHCEGHSFFHGAWVVVVWKERGG